MAQDINIANDLYDLLATHNFDVESADKSGNPVGPEDGRIFKFDWVSASGKNYGTAVLVIGEEDELMLFFGDNLGKGMEEPDKSEWHSFLQQLSNFSTRHGFHTFSPKNLNQLRHTMTGLAAIKEGLFESYYGTRRVSYMGEPTDARMVINHNRVLGEDDKRYRYVESLFIETADGEKFKMQFRNLKGGRAMLEHVRHGGKPYDVRGQHITEIVQEMAVLSRFNRASRNRVFEGQIQNLVEHAQQYYHSLQNNLKHLGSARGYKQYFESWSPTDGLEGESLVEDLKTMFVEQTLDARIEAALPTLAKLQQQGNAMKEAQIFENWVNNIMEGTWALPDTPETQAKLNDLMSKELIVGPDATNATEQLYDVLGDDQLFDILGNLAAQDPRANIWDDTDVQARLKELGVQLPTQTPTPDQQQPVAPAAGQQAPGTAPEQGMAEAAKWRDPQYKGKLYTQEPGDSDEYDSIDYGYEIGLRPENDPGQKRRMGGVGSKYDRTDPLIKGFGRYGVGEPVSKGPRKGLPSRDQITSLKQSIRDISGKHPRPNLPEQGMAENTELNTMLKYAGIPVQESVLTDSTGHTLDHILKRFTKEVADFEAGGEIDDDLYHALYDYYFDDMPYGTKKARDGDPYEWVSQRLADELGVNEGWKGELAGGTLGGVGGTVAGSALGALAAGPVGAAIGGVVGGAAGGTGGAMLGREMTKEGSCNSTMEGEYCPEHGLMECGMYEMGTVAGGMAPVIGEAPQDAINYNGAVTGSYYESDELARIKTLALLK